MKNKKVSRLDKKKFLSFGVQISTNSNISLTIQPESRYMRNRLLEKIAKTKKYAGTLACMNKYYYFRGDNLKINIHRK